FVTWGTNPGQGLPLGSVVPDPEAAGDDNEKSAIAKALEYMDLTPGTPLRDISIDTVFLGSCTNARIEDLRVAAEVVEGRTIVPDTRMIVVPATGVVKKQAESEGVDKVFLKLGPAWRTAGCSMCLAMTPDEHKPGGPSAST